MPKLHDKNFFIVEYNMDSFAKVWFQHSLFLLQTSIYLKKDAMLQSSVWIECI